MAFIKCKEVIQVRWKRINEDGQMDREPINKTTLQQKAKAKCIPLLIYICIPGLRKSTQKQEIHKHTHGPKGFSKLYVWIFSYIC